MTRDEALIAIVVGALRKTHSVVGNRKILEGLRVLGFRDKELMRAGIYLELWHGDGRAYLRREPRSPSFEEANRELDSNPQR